MSAEGAPFKRSRQKPRFLAAAYGVMSAEIAEGNFSQIKQSSKQLWQKSESPVTSLQSPALGLLAPGF
jgi:hypothetical protein